MPKPYDYPTALKEYRAAVNSLTAKVNIFNGQLTHAEDMMKTALDLYLQGKSDGATYHQMKANYDLILAARDRALELRAAMREPRRPRDPSDIALISANSAWSLPWNRE